jgi:hypothetical protein
MDRPPAVGYQTPYAFAWQETEMAARAYHGLCPACGGTTESREAWIAFLSLIVAHRCSCGQEFLECRTVAHLGVEAALCRSASGALAPAGPLPGYYDEAARLRFAQDARRLHEAEPVDAGGGLLVPALTNNVWHITVDFLYMAHHHQSSFPGPVTTCTFPEYAALAGLVTKRVTTLPYGEIRRVVNGFAYVAQMVAPGAEDDHRDLPSVMGYTPFRRRDRRVFLDHLAGLIPAETFPFRPALFLTVRFGSRRWLPLFEKTQEVISLFHATYPTGGVILHGTPRADGFALDPDWQALATDPRIVTVFDADVLTQARWCGAADVCLQGSGAALFLPAIFDTPTVILGYEPNFLTEYVGMAQDRTIVLPASDFSQDTPVNRSYREPTAREALDAVVELIDRHGYRSHVSLSAGAPFTRAGDTHLGDRR